MPLTIGLMRLFSRSRWWHVLLCLIPWLCLPLVFKSIYFRDYAIIYDAAYRMYLGHLPYQDFGLPVGPVSLLLPWLSFLIGGPNWYSLLFCQVLISSIALAGFLKVLSLLEFKLGYILLAGFSWVAFYCWPNHLPWYNTTALSLEIWALVPMLIFLKQPDGISVVRSLGLGSVIGILIGLCLLTKQDFGVYASAFVLGGLLLPMLISLVVYRKVNLKPTLLVFISLIIAAGLVVLFCFWLMPEPGFSYWFNYGQPPHFSRIEHGRFGRVLKELDAKHFFFVVVFALLLYYFKQYPKALKDKKVTLTIYVLGFFLLQSFLTSATSGLKSSHLYFVAPSFLLIYYLLRSVNFPILVWVLTLLIPAAEAINTIRKPNLQLFWFNASKKQNPLDADPNQTYAKAKHPLLSPFYLPTPANKNIDIIIALIDSVKRENRDGNFKVLNMTELPVLNQITNTIPPKGLPLWYDIYVTFFPSKQKQFLQQIRNRTFDVLLIQRAHSPFLPKLKDELLGCYICRGSYQAVAARCNVEIWIKIK